LVLAILISLARNKGVGGGASVSMVIFFYKKGWWDEYGEKEVKNEFAWNCCKPFVINV